MLEQTSNRHCITIELPALTDEAAAFLKKFSEALTYAIDEHYYQQIHRYYKQQLDQMLLVSEPVPYTILDNPPRFEYID